MSRIAETQKRIMRAIISSDGLRHEIGHVSEEITGQIDTEAFGMNHGLSTMPEPERRAN